MKQILSVPARFVEVDRAGVGLESWDRWPDNRRMGFSDIGTPDLAQYRVQRHFADHRAVAPGDAIEYVPGTPAERRAFDRLRLRGVIRETQPAQYWFDLDSMGIAPPRRTNPKTYVAIALAAVVAVLTWMLGTS